jgi:hypothetical protein
MVISITDDKLNTHERQVRKDRAEGGNLLENPLIQREGSFKTGLFNSVTWKGPKRITDDFNKCHEVVKSKGSQVTLASGKLPYIFPWAGAWIQMGTNMQKSNIQGLQANRTSC